ncbi:unnamed protein product [Peronospora effusa]|uniref:Uncharacterized protein n=1 Tax=Peronospora effusa TaxID=542832 RepID=A0A425CNL8_9STRA|nr:hypothetical protein DD237_008560 [Peronospora effusa]CAI5708663.1 unnamed protein product [Peronospora effusa]
MPPFLVDNRTQILRFFRLVVTQPGSRRVASAFVKLVAKSQLNLFGLKHRITKKKRWVKAAVVDQRVEVQDRRDQVNQERKEVEAQRPQKRRPTTVQTS